MQELYIIALKEISGFGLKTVSVTLNTLADLSIESPEHLHALLTENWSAITANVRVRRGIPDLDELLTGVQTADQIIDASNQNDIGMIGIENTLYPPLLKQIDDPPLMLFYKGDATILSQSAVAVVGTREPSSIGEKVAHRLGYLFAERGLIVVSGLALGCDTLAHQGCLEADGQTVAVLAHGLDRISPKDNTALAESILANGGCLVTEYSIGERPQSAYFVQRDRIQSGLSSGVAVVETGVTGGTMKTVGYCKQQQRILACYKHSDNQRNEKSEGNEKLLSEGALPLGSPEHIEQFIHTMFPNMSAPQHEIQAVIFDLDMTLVDSSSVEHLRSQRKWRDIYSLIADIQPYNGVDEILKSLKERGIKVAVVTSSPRPYCERILSYLQWDIDVVVCYHDTKQHKPHPAPFELALQKLQVRPSQAITVGDQPNDIKASHTAGIPVVAAMWGGAKPEAMQAENPTYVFESLKDIRNLFDQLFRPQ